MRRLPLLPLPPLLSLLLSACELTEVTIPQGQPTVIVQAVISARRPGQFVVVEHSLTGTQTDSASEQTIPPGEPREPIAGATVVLTHEGPSTCATPVDTLSPQSPTSGVYRTSGFCTLEPGDRVSLRVVTPAGDTVTGATTIPGARSVSVRLATDSAQVEGETLELDRQRDTIRIGVEAILARALQVEIRWRDEPDSLVFYAPTDTLGIAIPADLYNPFAGDSGKPVFEAGREYALGISVTDTNYYDFVRSGSDPFTGRGFLNHLEGGVGVFGSVATYTYYLRVVR